MTQEDLEAALGRVLDAKLDKYLVPQPIHHREHEVVRSVFGNGKEVDQDKVDNWKNIYKFFEKWQKRTEKLGGKVFMGVFFAVMVFAIAMSGNGLLAYLKGLLAGLPVAGGFIKTK